MRHCYILWGKHFVTIWIVNGILWCHSFWKKEMQNLKNLWKCTEDKKNVVWNQIFQLFFNLFNHTLLHSVVKYHILETYYYCHWKMTQSFDQIEEHSGIWLIRIPRLIPLGFTGSRKDSCCRAKHTWIKATKYH